MLIKKRLTAFILTFLLVAPSFGADLTFLHWHKYFPPDDNSAEPLVSLIDNLGNIVIAGVSLKTFNGENNTPPISPLIESRWSNFIMKLNPQGQYMWHTFLGRSSQFNNDFAMDMAIDSANNIIVGGSSHLSWDGPSSTAPLNDFSGGTLDGYLLKVNKNGEYQWHSFYGSGVDFIGDVAIDSFDNVYALGSSNALWNVKNVSPLNVPQGTVLGFLGDQASIFVIKVNTDGTYDWHTFYGSATFSTLELGAIEIIKENDDNDYIYIASKSSSSWEGDNGEMAINAISKSDNASDLFLLKLNQNGDYQWHTFQGSGLSNRYDLKIAVSDFNEVYVAGTAFQPWLGNASIMPLNQYQGSLDIFVQSFNKDGEYLWHSYYGSIEDDVAVDINVDIDNNIYVAGSGSDSNLLGSEWVNSVDSDPIYPFVESPRRNDVIISVNHLGDYKWHAFLGAAINAILPTRDRAMYVTGLGGTFASSFDLIAADTPAPLSDEDKGILLAKFDLAGAVPSYSNNTLNLPEVQVGDDLYSATLILVAGIAPLTLELNQASHIGPANKTVMAVFANSILSIEELVVGSEIYTVELKLVPNSNPLRFTLANVNNR